MASTQPSPTGGAAPPDPARVPAHVVWVGGGSARWLAGGPGPDALAAAQDLALLALVDSAAELGVRWLTVQEPSEGRALLGRLDDLARRGIAVRSLPEPPVAWTGDGPVLTVVAAAARSGRAELVDAVRRLADEGVAPRQVDERSLARHLYLPEAPEPDLLVVTGGERRVPDLLLWEVAYSELVFLDVLWPDVRRHHLADAVVEYQGRDRRYGGLVAPGAPR